ncbi:signal peptidase II [Candidatus Peregrinibacteria bacterium]|jgi:signal peptidase II|nr:signal peptidase II [Candidatus Peregrinibacteria bacterium]
MIRSFKKLDKLWLLFAPFFAVLVGADQLTKLWAKNNLSLSNPDVGFSLSYNDGIIFGIDLPLWSIFVLSFGILGFGAYLVIENKLWRDTWHMTGLALISAGAIGNLIDRAIYGHVIDFIKIYWWPTFNLADAFIVSGVVLFLWIVLVREETISEI